MGSASELLRLIIRYAIEISVVKELGKASLRMLPMASLSSQNAKVKLLVESLNVKLKNNAIASAFDCSLLLLYILEILLDILYTFIIMKLLSLRQTILAHCPFKYSLNTYNYVFSISR